MSAVKKVFKKIKENKILKTVAIVAAAWYLAGAASAYFNGPQSVGLADSLAASGESMWSSVAGEAGFQSATEVAASNVASGAATLSTPAGAVVGQGAITETALAPTVTPGIEEAAYQASLETGAGTATDLAAKEAGGGMLDAAGNWIKANPMATAVIAGGVSSAMTPVPETPPAPQYGAFGMGASGEWQGQSRTVGGEQPGIVAGQVNALRTPAVAGQQGQVVARPGAKTPINKNKLAGLNNGIITKQRVGGV